MVRICKRIYNKSNKYRKSKRVFLGRYWNGRGEYRRDVYFDYFSTRVKPGCPKRAARRVYVRRDHVEMSSSEIRFWGECVDDVSK